MSQTAIAPSTEKPDWRDRQLKKKHAKLIRVRRENERLKELLKAHGISVPDTQEPSID
jgi:hypothetical protein